jgi:16S rRNA (uracil1498-N3)-methyltransferase
MHPDLRAGPLVFVDDLASPRLDDGDWHHLTRVLRVAPGERLCLSDGAGSWRTARLAQEPGDLGEVIATDRPSPAVCIGVAVPKGSRIDLTVQKLTELGVDRIALLHTSRSVVRWDAGDVSGRLDRLRRVAREAAMQSRQLHLPVVEGPVTPAELVARGAPVALAEPDGGPPVPGTTVLIGPEGGWAPEELVLSDHRVGLGPSILRVETAAITLGAHLCAQRDQWWT